MIDVHTNPLAPHTFGKKIISFFFLKKNHKTCTKVSPRAKYWKSIFLRVYFWKNNHLPDQMLKTGGSIVLFNFAIHKIP
jgi:hypothetical protein